MSVRTFWRLAALTLIFSLLLVSSPGYAYDRLGDIPGSMWQLPGYSGGGLDGTGDPDGVQGSPPSGARKSGASSPVAPVGGVTGKGGWRAVWAHWVTGLLQHIGYRY